MVQLRKLKSLFESPFFWGSVLGAAAFMTYCQTLGYALVWDDPFILAVLRERVAQEGFPVLFSSDFRLEIEKPLGYYRPVINLSFWIDSLLARFFPPVFHLTNIVLHTANTLLVFWLARLILAELWGAVAAAALFALHPVHIESVAFVSGRTDLWAAFFVILSAVAFVKERSGRPHSPWPHVLWGSGSLVLGALSKEMALLLPAALTAYTFLNPNTASVKERIRALLPWLAGWAVAVVLVVGMRLGLVEMPFGAGKIHTGQLSLLTSDPLRTLGVWAMYLKLLWFPWPIVPFYSARQLMLSPQSVLGAVAFIILCVFYSSRSRRRVGLIGLTWMMVFLLPVSGLVPMQGALAAQRFLYLPSLGFCLVAGYALSRFFGRSSGGLAAVTASVAGAVLLAVATMTSASFWKDDLSLAEHLTMLTPEVLVGQRMMGHALSSRGREREALAYFSRCVDLQPDSYDELYNFGVSLFRLQRYDEAAKAFRRAVEVESDKAWGWNNLGLAMISLQQFDAAARALERATIIDPDNGTFRQNLARIYASTGNAPRASEQLRVLERIDPMAAARLKGELKL